VNKAYKYFLTLLLITAFLFSFTLQSIARVKEDNQLKSIDDPNHYFTEDELMQLEKGIKDLPESYKIILLPSIKGSIEETAETFYKIRQYSQDTILIIAAAEQKEIFIITGEALEKKGLNKEFFTNEIDRYFVPTIKNDTLANALIYLMKGISKDISKQIIETERKEVPKIPTPPKEALDKEQSGILLTPFVIIASLLLIVIVIWLFTKKTFKTRK